MKEEYRVGVPEDRTRVSADGTSEMLTRHNKNAENHWGLDLNKNLAMEVLQNRFQFYFIYKLFFNYKHN